MNKGIKQIAKHYGFYHQVSKTNEECGEFIAALNRFANGADNRKNVIEEMADVLVMLEQMQYFLCIHPSEIQKAIDSKVRRQIERMNRR